VSNEQKKEDQISWWNDSKAWINRLWWIRGGVAAISVASIVPEVTDLSRYEFLRAMYAIVIKWGSWTRSIADLVAPYIPVFDIDYLDISSFIIWSCFGVSYVYMGVSVFSKETEWQKLSFSEYTTNEDSIVEKFHKFYEYYFTKYIAILFLFSVIVGFLALQMFVEQTVLILRNYYFLFSIFDNTDSVIAIIFYALVVYCNMKWIFIPTLRYIPALRKGIIHMVVFWGVLQGLYYLEVPVFADWVNYTTCSVMEAGEADCPTSGNQNFK